MRIWTEARKLIPNLLLRRAQIRLFSTLLHPNTLILLRFCLSSLVDKDLNATDKINVSMAKEESHDSNSSSFLHLLLCMRLRESIWIFIPSYLQEDFLIQRDLWRFFFQGRGSNSPKNMETGNDRKGEETKATFFSSFQEETVANFCVA